MSTLSSIRLKPRATGLSGLEALAVEVAVRRKQRDESILPPWRCGHRCLIVVSATEGGSKRAQCLGCKGVGPEGEDAEQALQRLLASDSYSLARRYMRISSTHPAVLR